MRAQYLTVLAAFMLSVGHADAQQWNDAIQWENTNVRIPFEPIAAGNPGYQPFAQTPTTNLYVTTDAFSCGAGTSQGPTFAAETSLLPSALPSSCVNAGQESIDLGQFARESDFAALQAEVAAMSQFDQIIHAEAVRTDQGVAMSLAMAGVGDLQSNEHIAFSGNWGAFQGRSGGAVGVAYRLSDHVSVNGGFAGSFSGSTYGFRAGIRVGW